MLDIVILTIKYKIHPINIKLSVEVYITQDRDTDLISELCNRNEEYMRKFLPFGLQYTKNCHLLRTEPEDGIKGCFT